MDEWIDEPDVDVNIDKRNEREELAVNLVHLANRIANLPQSLETKLNTAIMSSLKRHALTLAADLKELANDVRGEY